MVYGSQGSASNHSKDYEWLRKKAHEVGENRSTRRYEEITR